MVKLNVSRILWTDTIAAQQYDLCVSNKKIVYKYQKPRQKLNKNRIQFTHKVAIQKC